MKIRNHKLKIDLTKTDTYWAITTFFMGDCFKLNFHDAIATYCLESKLYNVPWIENSESLLPLLFGKKLNDQQIVSAEAVLDGYKELLGDIVTIRVERIIFNSN